MFRLKRFGRTGSLMMNRQKSFESHRPTLYLVPTPIGNRQEMTERALKILESVDCIAAEDTRNTRTLLQMYGIHTPLISHHEHNQAQSIQQITDRLAQGQSLAVVSDAGYPLISDPGQNLVRRILEQGYPVVSVSGANAALNALVASGLDCHHYVFYGFLDHKSSHRKKELERLATIPFTMIFYEAPHRIEVTLKDILEVLGDRNMCLARELTKVHEEYLRGTVSEILAVAASCKGEMVIVIEGAVKKEDPDMDQLAQKVLKYAETMRLKDAAAQVSKEYNVSKNQLYQMALQQKDN